MKPAWMKAGVMLLVAAAWVTHAATNNPPTAVAIEKADRVLVEKSAHRLSLFRGDRLLAKYHVVFGDEPRGHKQQQGDERTPEGDYVLDWKKPDSAYHRAIHVSYPNSADRKAAQRRGVDPGGLIMIHGQPNGMAAFEAITQARNWTDGCIALRNADMDDVWLRVDAGTPIRIEP